MAITVKTFDEMVDDILDRIVSADIGFDEESKSNSSVLRTIIEAIVSELDIQNYQIQYVYDNLDIDLLSGDDLDRAIKIFNVYRSKATPCIGTIDFNRSTPATFDIPIPAGTIISTRPDIDGVVNEFETIEDGILKAGQSKISIGIQSIEPGNIMLSPGALCILNTPILGIDTVNNRLQVNGGTEDEDDDSLRYRAKLALQKLGKGTTHALEGAILDIAGVKSVTVLDMHRGVGTTDIIVACDNNPPSKELQTAVDKAIETTKASGISVKALYPTIKTIDISITLTTRYGIHATSVQDGVGKAIHEYGMSLGVSEPFIIKQMEREILSNINSILDMKTVKPTDNITCGDTEIIRPGTITIDGEEWKHE